MQVVLLAAGMGLRLGPLTRTTPKALIDLNGQALIDYTLPHLLSNKQVHEVIVAGGFEFNLLKSHLESHYAPFGDRIRLVRNFNFTKGNIFTLGAALPFVEGSFLLCNVDHIFHENTWKDILVERPQVSIFCDFLREFQDDEMKVLLDEDKKLMGMSKTMTEYDGAYVGLTQVSKESSHSYHQAFEQAIQEHGDKAVVENILPIFSREGGAVGVIPFDKNTWYEVDTREDLARAEAALNSNDLEDLSLAE